MDAVLNQLRTEGYPVRPEDEARLKPSAFQATAFGIVLLGRGNSLVRRINTVSIVQKAGWKKSHLHAVAHPLWVLRVHRRHGDGLTTER